MGHLSMMDMARRPMAKKKGWIKKAMAHADKGAFRRKAEAAGETTRAFAKEHEGSPGKIGKQARLAEALMGAGKGRGSVLYKHKD